MQLQTNLKTLQRQSTALMSAAADDDKLTNALLEIETLQKKLSDSEQNSQEKVCTYVCMCLSVPHFVYLCLYTRRLKS